MTGIVAMREFSLAYIWLDCVYTSRFTEDMKRRSARITLAERVAENNSEHVRAAERAE